MVFRFAASPYLFAELLTWHDSDIVHSSCWAPPKVTDVHRQLDRTYNDARQDFENRHASYPPAQHTENIIKPPRPDWYKGRAMRTGAMTVRTVIGTCRLPGNSYPKPNSLTFHALLWCPALNPWAMSILGQFRKAYTNESISDRPQ